MEVTRVKNNLLNPKHCNGCKFCTIPNFTVYPRRGFCTLGYWNIESGVYIPAMIKVADSYKIIRRDKCIKETGQEPVGWVHIHSDERGGYLVKGDLRDDVKKEIAKAEQEMEPGYSTKIEHTNYNEAVGKIYGELIYPVGKIETNKKVNRSFKPHPGYTREDAARDMKKKKRCKKK